MYGVKARETGVPCPQAALLSNHRDLPTNREPIIEILEPINLKPIENLSERDPGTNREPEPITEILKPIENLSERDPGTNR